MDAPKKPDAKAKLLEQLHNPTKLRSLVTVVILLAGYAGVYMPFSTGMEATSKLRGKEKRRLELARDVEHLRVQYDSFKKRLPKQRDPNEWVEYTLDGVRKFPMLKLSKLDKEVPRDFGPYKLVAIRLECEGVFKDMDGLLNWFETNERMYRVDLVKIAPHRSGNGILVMQLVVLGVMG